MAKTALYIVLVSVFMLSFSLPDGDDEASGDESNKTHQIKKHKGKYLGVMVWQTQALTNALIAERLTDDSTQSHYSAEEAAGNDSLIKVRLRKLSETREIPMTFNPAVKSYIRKYAIENPEKVSAILGRSAYYYPVFDHYLHTHGLPPELKHLAAVESALDPNAVSSSGAVGLWQFLPGSAGLFDLRMDAWLDERRDVYKSTEAACEYLSYLYRIFNDWHLALAAYNGGPGAVEKSIARAGGETNYWKIRPHVSDQMKIYVPAFIAMNYVLAYHKDFGIEAALPPVHYHQTDTVHVTQEVYLDRVAEVLEVDPAIIRELNPVYRKAVIPKSKQGYHLVLPGSLSIGYLMNSDKIAGKPPSETESPDGTEKNRIEYVVKKGDSLHKIAIRYHCTIDEIRQWNNLPKTHPLRYNERLILYVR
jgi:membrane-bound lytic murein transglycosylase D